jgi:bifunctional non-homologous end joining protein LigD
MCFTGLQQDFEKLWNRTHDHEVKLCAFDLLELNGQDFRERNLVERKQELLKIIRRCVGIEYVEHLTGNGSQIFEHACKLGLEGIVSKRVDKPYAAGVSKFWLKTKNKNHPAMERVREAFRNR